jgi:hypothetical protein
MNQTLRRLAPSVVLNIVIPLLVYTMLRPHVGSDAVALAVGAAIPVLVTAGGFALRRRIDPVGVLAIIGIGAALILLALTGGDPLVLKIHDALLTGPLGLVCLISVLVGKPLLLVAQRAVAARRGTSAPGNPRAASILTGIVGAMLVIHALVLLALALAMPTTTFLAVGKPVGWAVLAAGVATLYWYRGRLASAQSRQSI